MPSHIVKPDPDQDFYVVWSTVVDAPTYFGTREALVAEMSQGAEVERFDRADEYGTSALWPDEKFRAFGWHDHDGFSLGEVEIDGADHERFFYSVPRRNLRALCERIGAGRTDVVDLLEVEDAA